MTNPSKRTWIILAVALCLILVGDLLACMTQTDWGKIKVRDVRFVGSNGVIRSALLYVPQGVTKKKPAPGIVAIHGYINSRETQDGFAIEFARRGYVVLALDETGHGYSDPPAFSGGFGGLDGIPYMRSLDIVDPDNIGLEGHSMGGWAIVTGAFFNQDGYKSMVLEGSSTGTYGAPDGSATFPRNLGLVYSEWDEFSALMWLTPVPKDVVKGDKLKTLFNTKDDVVVGQLYGSIADGTARKLYMPRNTHPWDHLSIEAIGDAVEWFQATLQGGNGLPPADQTWYWKEIGNLIALIGMILLLFPVGKLLLALNFFKGLAEAPAEAKPARGIGWWICAAILVILPIVTYFPFKELPITLGWDPASAAIAFFPEGITTQIMFWAVLNGLIALVLFVIWHFAFNRKTGANGSNYGLTWGTALDWGKIGKSFLLAVAIAFIAYLTLAFSDWLFKVDYRIWFFAVKPMSSLHFLIFLCYLIPFAFFYVVLATVLSGQLRPLIKNKELSLGIEMLINVALLVLGFIGLMLVEYIPLMAGGTLANPAEPLFTIVAIQFIPLMTIAALAFTYFFRNTGHIYTGAFLVAMLVVWIVVASQAIHFAF
ncbi:MAG: alpha/beta hydrolase [Chloroflexi bacterium]|nr:alpha/beta hydrolase [Chloroflexota bacterium]